MLRLYKEYDDDHLLEKISEGNAQSFNRLYKKYWSIVYNHAYKRLNDHSKAQDITQDVFCKLWVKRESLHIDNLPAYLYTAVRNRVLNLFEKEKRYVPFELLLHKKFTAADQADKRALQNEFLVAYRKLIESLPEKRKNIFLQYYEMGKSTDEIAEQLMLSRKTVQNQLGRAVAFLKTGLSHLFILVVILWL